MVLTYKETNLFFLCNDALVRLVAAFALDVQRWEKEWRSGRTKNGQNYGGKKR